jgi:hypothetical protein
MCQKILSHVVDESIAIGNFTVPSWSLYLDDEVQVFLLDLRKYIDGSPDAGTTKAKSKTRTRKRQQSPVESAVWWLI